MLRLNFCFQNTDAIMAKGVARDFVWIWELRYEFSESGRVRISVAKSENCFIRCYFLVLQIYGRSLTEENSYFYDHSMKNWLMDYKLNFLCNVIKGRRYANGG